MSLAGLSMPLLDFPILDSAQPQPSVRASRNPLTSEELIPKLNEPGNNVFCPLARAVDLYPQVAGVNCAGKPGSKRTAMHASRRYVPRLCAKLAATAEGEML